MNIDSVVESLKVSQNTVSSVNPGPGGARAGRFSSSMGAGGVTDLVDLFGLQSITDAITMLGKTEALPLPESVGRAIRQLASEALDGLPKGGSVH